MRWSVRTALLLLALLTACGAQAAGDFWIKFPHPKTIYVTQDIGKLPSLAPGKDPGGHYGSLGYMLQSLSGLAALSCSEGRGDAMVWINHASNDNYSMWLDTVLTVTKAKRIDQTDSLALVKELARKGGIRGYIVYRADRSERALYGKDPEKASGYDESVNVATTMSPILRGIIVEESVEGTFAKLGLRRLFDARGKTQEWVFAKYSGKLNRSIVHLADPKMPFCRDYAIATRAMNVYGTGAFTDKVLAWVKPNSPVLGWNSGDDEFRITEQVSRWGKFITASNWCLNLPLLSVVRAGTDVPWENLRPGERSRVDPLSLEWRTGVHYTSFVMTDGDNLQWYTGSFCSGSDQYWASPSRGRFPLGWTTCADSMSQVNVPTLSYLSTTASPNDSFVLFPGGYYYADRYGAADKDGKAYLEGHIDQVAETMGRLGLTVMMTNSPEWESPESLRAYARFAKGIPNLAGILVIQYCPYTGGQGKVRWTVNREGEAIPIVPAKYGIWEHHSAFPNEGPPAYTASRINLAAHEGPITSDEYIDWCTVHAWSYFQTADTRGDLWAEDTDQGHPEETGVTRGVAPVEWCVDRLDDHVKVITPEELVWRIRLHLKTRETLSALSSRAMREPLLPGLVRDKLKKYRDGLPTRSLKTDDERRSAYEELRSIVRGQAGG